MAKKKAAPKKATTATTSNFAKFQAGQNNSSVFAGTGENKMNESQMLAAWGLTSDQASMPVIIKHKQGGTAPVLKSVLSILDNLTGQSPGYISSLQQQLMASGYLPQSNSYKTPLGVLDNKTVVGYENLLNDAARSHQTINEFITTASASRKSAGIGAAGPVSIQKTSPDALREAAITAGQKLLGRNPDEGFIQNFVKTYQAGEASAQSAAAGGGSYTAPASPQEAASAALRQKNPQQVQAFGEEQGMSALDQLIENTKGNASR